MADAKVQATKDSVSGGDLGDSIPVGTKEISLLLRDLTGRIEKLAQRVDVLEQSQKDSKSEQSKKTPENIIAPDDSKQKQKSVPTRRTSNREALIQSHVEFRKKEYVADAKKFDWVLVTADTEKDDSSKRKPFRYDTGESGKLTFSVFRSAKLYQTLLTLCPPAHDGQVSLVEDRLEFQDVFPLLHCREGLMKYKKKLEKNATTVEIREELEVIEGLYEREGHLMYAQQRYDELRNKLQIDCESLKALFFKGQLVVFRQLRDEWAVARVNMVTANDEIYYSLGKDVSLQLECEEIDFDGKSFRTHVYRKDMEVFTGTRKISELSVYPLEFFEGKDNLVKRSISSGASWWRMHNNMVNAKQPGVAVMHYDGYCETFGEDAYDDEKGGKGAQLSSRVIVDFKRFPDRYLQFTDDNFKYFETDPTAAFSGKPEENPLVLCPERVLVHSLSDNEWYYVAMTGLEEPVWAKDAWKRLVKPRSVSANSGIEKSIERIQRLAKAHQSAMAKDDTMDNFTGKGKGLTFLLHGPPGVGKTMLAECLSEEHKRPLYRINLGRLIIETNWESKIDEIFRQAHSWGAILLVDEAEVILAERTQESMHQSAWVAVFLRKIEYFEGVIFLTTNLIHMIDPAFISRVNLGFRIPALDAETRRDIWHKMLGDLQKENEANLLKTEDIVEWAERYELNGRQIRNVIHSACLLASTPMTGKVTKESIEDALEDVENFKGMIETEKKEVEQSHLSHWS